MRVQLNCIASVAHLKTSYTVLNSVLNCASPSGLTKESLNAFKRLVKKMF